jgi:hypothetical protein
MSDVTITSPINTNVLQYNGSQWINAVPPAAGVASFNGRVGAVIPAEADYALTQLGDVTITGAVANQVLQYNGSQWINSASGTAPVTSVFGRVGAILAQEGDYALTTLADVQLILPTINQALQYDGFQWINSAINLQQLADVNIVAPVATQFLQFNGSQWANTSVVPAPVEQQIFMNSKGNLIDNQFYGISGMDSVGAKVSFLPAKTMTITKMRILINAAPGLGRSWIFTLRRNGINTGLIGTMTGNTTLTTFTGSEVFTDNDLISIFVSSAAAPAAVSQSMVTLIYS